MLTRTLQPAPEESVQVGKITVKYETPIALVMIVNAFKQNTTKYIIYTSVTVVKRYKIKV